MGERSFLKYFTLVSLAFSVARGIMKKAKEAKAPDSEGGEKITTLEWVEIGMVIEDEIMERIPEIEAVVILKPKQNL
jgi:hypothetical protein